MRILTGLRCSAEQLHVWNYLWAFKPLIDLSYGNETFLMLADMHSFTTVHDWDQMRHNRREVLLNYFSLIPEERLSDMFIFEQSKVVNHMNIVWLLSSVTPYSLILRSHAFKDSQVKNSDINMALFNYSVLMTADIINFDAQKVPVWKDQKQHIEFARDIAWFFNKTYNTDIFTLPEAEISEEVWLIPGLDGRKMSKSYDNFIWLFETSKNLKKKIMSIPTDDASLEDVKNPDTCNVFNLIKFFADATKTQEIKNKYLQWGYGYGHAKLELLEILTEYLKPFQERRRYYERNFSEIENYLERWNKKANEVVDKKYNKMKQIVWLTT